LSSQRQALALMRLRQLDRRPDELSLAYVLDGLVGQSARDRSTPTVAGKDAYG
jgi:hypothetical protein